MTRTQLLLVLLMEECGETAQRASKAIRFRLDEIQPDQTLNNSERIIYEFNDIVAVMELLKEEGHINTVIDREAIEKKKEKIKKYIDYSIQLGTVSK